MSYVRLEMEEKKKSLLPFSHHSLPPYPKGHHTLLGLKSSPLTQEHYQPPTSELLQFIKGVVKIVPSKQTCDISKGRLAQFFLNHYSTYHCSWQNTSVHSDCIHRKQSSGLAWPELREAGVKRSVAEELLLLHVRFIDFLTQTRLCSVALQCNWKSVRFHKENFMKAGREEN